MSVSVRRLENEQFHLSIHGHDVILDGPAFRALVEDMAALLDRPDGLGSDDETRAFLLNIRRGSDVGVQALLRVADHDDVLALLKASEKDQRAHKKLFENMGETSRKISSSCDSENPARFKALKLSAHSPFSAVGPLRFSRSRRVRAAARSSTILSN